MISNSRLVLLFAMTIFPLVIFLGVVLTEEHIDSRASSQNLADRINTVCKRGYHLSDWTTGAEYGNAPVEGIVLVICESDRANEFGQRATYRVAVQR